MEQTTGLKRKNEKNIIQKRVVNECINLFKKI